jgi:hypothetical protein
MSASSDMTAGDSGDRQVRTLRDLLRQTAAEIESVAVSEASAGLGGPLVPLGWAPEHAVPDDAYGRWLELALSMPLIDPWSCFELYEDIDEDEDKPPSGHRVGVSAGQPVKVYQPLLKAEDIMKRLKISKSAAYELMDRLGAFHSGRSKRLHPDKLTEHIEAGGAKQWHTPVTTLPFTDAAKRGGARSTTTKANGFDAARTSKIKEWRKKLRAPSKKRSLAA